MGMFENVAQFVRKSLTPEIDNRLGNRRAIVPPEPINPRRVAIAPSFEAEATSEEIISAQEQPAVDDQAMVGVGLEGRYKAINEKIAQLKHDIENLRTQMQHKLDQADDLRQQRIDPILYGRSRYQDVLDNQGCWMGKRLQSEPGLLDLSMKIGQIEGQLRKSGVIPTNSVPAERRVSGARSIVEEEAVLVDPSTVQRLGVAAMTDPTLSQAWPKLADNYERLMAAYLQEKSAYSQQMREVRQLRAWMRDLAKQVYEWKMKRQEITRMHEELIETKRRRERLHKILLPLSNDQSDSIVKEFLLGLRALNHDQPITDNQRQMISGLYKQINRHNVTDVLNDIESLLARQTTDHPANLMDLMKQANAQSQRRAA